MSSSFIIPTIHPARFTKADISSCGPAIFEVWKDFEKAARIARGDWAQVENLVVVHPSAPVPLERLVRDALAWMDRWLALGCAVAVDVETSALDFRRCKHWSTALAGEDPDYWTAVAFTMLDLPSLPHQAALALHAKMRQILASPSNTKIFHNAPFDYAVLVGKGYEINGPIEDTMAMHHIVQPDVPHDLGWVGHTYLDVEPWKLNHEGFKQVHTPDLVELLVYNAKDALNTVKLRRPLFDEIHRRGMNDRLVMYQCAFARLAARMELRGIPINHAMRQAEAAVIEEQLAKWLFSLRSYLNWPDFNPNAPAHVRDALFSPKYLGLSPTKFTKTGLPTTSRKSDAVLSLIDTHPFVADLVKYQEKRALHSGIYRDYKANGHLSEFMAAVHEDGRLHPKWKPTGTVGSRWASTPNAQNIPLLSRKMFEAAEGWCFVGSDKAALELRVAACLAGVSELVAELQKPDGDPHTLAARNIYGEQFERLGPVDRKLLREAVKNVVYASIYGAGEEKVYETIRASKNLKPETRATLTRDMVGHIYRSYLGKYVEIPLYHEANYRKAQREGFLEVQPLGRRRFYPLKPPPFTEVANWGIQVCGSDIVTMQMVHIQEELDQRFPDAGIVLHGHDAVAVECRIEHAEAVKEIVVRHFGTYWLDGPAGRVNLSADVKIGKNLYEVK